MSKPTFSGAAGEAVDLYILGCELCWVGHNLSPEQLKKAQMVTLRVGLTGIADDYASGLEMEEQRNFDILSKRLTERFPIRKKKTDTLETLNRVMRINQGSKTFKAYCDEALALKPLLSADMETILARRWADGLNNRSLADALSMQQAVWNEADEKDPQEAEKNLNIQRTIDCAKFSAT